MSIRLLCCVRLVTVLCIPGVRFLISCPWPTLMILTVGCRVGLVWAGRCSCWQWLVLMPVSALSEGAVALRMIGMLSVCVCMMVRLWVEQWKLLRRPQEVLRLLLMMTSFVCGSGARMVECALSIMWVLLCLVVS